MIRSLLILLVILTTASSSFGLEVTFQQTASVDDITITLGDIAQFSEESDTSRALASQTVGQAPPPGQTVTLDTGEIKQHLIDTLSLSPAIRWSGPATLTVKRSSVRVGTSQLTEIINNFLNQHRNDLPDAEIRFIPAALPMPFLLPAGELTWEVIPSNPAILGSNRMAIIFRVDGRVRKNISVRGRLEILSPVAVTTASLGKGTLLHQEHLALVTLDISELDKPCTNLDEVLGKRLKRSMRAGKPLSLNNVEFPPLVRRGEVVKIVIHNGQLQLSASGVARDDGILNQMIRVQNLSSNKIIYCRVAAPGLVEVTL